MGRHKLATNSVEVIDAISNLGFGTSSELRREPWASSGPWEWSLRGCGFGTGWLSGTRGSGPFCSLAFMTWGLAGLGSQLCSDDRCPLKHGLLR